MDSSTGSSVEARIERMRRFYAMDNADGPIFGLYQAPYYPLRRYRGAASIPAGPFQASDLDVSRFLPDYERLHQVYQDLEGDYVWTASAFWGVPWVEVVAGCTAVADHVTGSSRTLPPLVAAGAEVRPAAFDAENPWVRKLREFVSAIAGQSRGRYPLGTTLMRGISDLLSALHGTPEFVYRLVDDPGAAAREAREIADLWIALAKAQLDLIPDFRGGVGSYFYNLWMPGRGVWIQEDAAALLSPALFERCLWPAIERIIASFDSVIIHLHPVGYIPVDQLVRSRLLAVEIHRDIAGAGVEELIPVYRKIQERKPLILWGDLSVPEIELVQRKLDRHALAILPVVRDAAEADGLRVRLGRAV